MLVLPTVTIELVHPTTVSGIRIISTAEQSLMLLTYLLNVVLEESSLNVVYLSMSWSSRHLSERTLFTLYV